MRSDVNFQISRAGLSHPARVLTNQIACSTVVIIYRDLLNETSNNLDRFWNVIKKLYPSNHTNLSLSMFQIGSVITPDPLTISNGFCSYFSTTVISLKKNIFPLRNCTWFFRVKESPKTDCQFKFETVSSQQVCKQLTSLK